MYLEELYHMDVVASVGIDTVETVDLSAPPVAVPLLAEPLQFIIEST